MKACTVGVLVVLGLVAGPGLTWAESDRVVAFENQVKPVFRRHCNTCHNPDRLSGGLDLTSLTAILEGSDSGEVVIKGKPDESLLYTLTAHIERPSMPPNSPKIPARAIDTLKRWIEGGLVEKIDPAAMAKAASPSAPASESKPTTEQQAGPTQKVAITAIAAHPEQPLVAVSGERQVHLLRLPDLESIATLPFPEGDVFDVGFSADGSLVFAAGGIGAQSGKVIVWEVASGERKWELGDEYDIILTADLSPDNRSLAIGGPSKTVKVLDTVSGKERYSIRKHADWVRSVAFSPDGLLLASGDRVGSLFVWEAASGAEFGNLAGHTAGVTALAWRTDGDQLASASEDGSVRLWDLHSLKQTREWQAHAKGVLTLAFPTPSTLATTGRDGTVCLWDAHGKPRQRFDDLADQVTALAVSRSTKLMIGGNYRGQWRAWPIKFAPMPQVVQALPGQTKPLASTRKLDILQRKLEAARLTAQSQQSLVAARESELAQTSQAIEHIQASLTALEQLQLAQQQALRLVQEQSRTTNLQVKQLEQEYAVMEIILNSTPAELAKQMTAREAALNQARQTLQRREMLLATTKATLKQLEQSGSASRSEAEALVTSLQREIDLARAAVADKEVELTGFREKWSQVRSQRAAKD